MHTARRQFIVFAGFLLVVRLCNCIPVLTIVSELMESNKSDRFGLSKYFKELGLNELCNLPIVENTDFKTFEENNSESSCLCTVIYRMAKELEASSYTIKVDLESAKKITIKFNDMKVYETWKRVTKVSPSLKILMESLINNLTKWNTVCYNEKEVVTKYCQFLNIEVLLLNNTLQTPNESPKEESILNILPSPKEPAIPSVVPKKPKIPDNLPKTNDIGSINESNVNDVQKPKEIDKYNYEDLVETDTSIKDMETISEDEPSQEKQTDAQISPETDSNDYPKESDGNGPITRTMVKETQLLYSQKNFTNRRYSGADDSHFLFYFSIMTVISMLFYLALYNKKKIIALIIEGRKGTNHRRRPNTATYSKVETEDGSNVF